MNSSSNYEYKIVNAEAIDRQVWQDYVDTHAEGTVFHTPYMYDVYRQTPNHVPFALFAIDDNCAIVAMLSGFVQTVSSMPLINKLSKRAVLMQSPLFNNEQALSNLLEGYVTFVRKQALYSEIRNHVDTQVVKAMFEATGFKHEEHLNILINLTESLETLWKGIHPKRRNEIRKAERNLVYVSKLKMEHLDKAYGILSEVYTRAGLPLMPFDFFRKALSMATDDCGLVVYGAFAKDQLIGTMFTLQYKKIVFDYYAGSLSEYYHLNPNDILPWKVMISTKEMGYELFDFGGAGKPNVEYGVRDYKIKFGGSLVNYGRYIAIHSPMKCWLAEKAFILLRKLKKMI